MALAGTGGMRPTLLLLATVACIDPQEPGTLVPPTVVDDPNLPQATITVAGQQRAIHIREFGDPDAPVLLITHGSVSDMHPYLPLQVLSDEWRVVFWDQRGNGLSERVDADELDFADMVDEMQAVKELVSPDAPVALMGHSWSAVHAAMAVAAYPASFDQVVLLEPNGFTSDIQNTIGLALNLMSPGYLDMNWSLDGMSAADHERLDWQMMGLLDSGVRKLNCDEDDLPPWPVWRPGGLALIAWEASLFQQGRLDFDLTAGMAEYPGRVLFVGTECSPLGSDFQEAGNMTHFGDAELLHIEDSGHRLVTEQFDALEAGLRGWLEVP